MQLLSVYSRTSFDRFLPRIKACISHSSFSHISASAKLLHERGLCCCCCWLGSRRWIATGAGGVRVRAQRRPLLRHLRQRPAQRTLHPGSTRYSPAFGILVFVLTRPLLPPTGIHVPLVAFLRTLFLYSSSTGCSETDFPLQLSADGPFSKGPAAERYKLFCVAPRGYGQSRPPERDFPLNFYDRDAEDLAIAMQVQSHYSFVHNAPCILLVNIPLYSYSCSLCYRDNTVRVLCIRFWLGAILITYRLSDWNWLVQYNVSE